MAAGFTEKQASAFRRTDGCFDGMEDFAKCAEISSDMVAALTGAGLGSGLGLISDMIRPVDKDENKLRRRLTALLGGAALGGMAGFGANQFRKNAPLFFPEKMSTPAKVVDTFDPAPSTAIAAAGLGYGLYPHFTNGGRVREWLNRDLRLLNGHPINWAAPESRELVSSIAAYNNAVRSGKITDRIGTLINRIPFLEKVNPWKNGLSGNTAVGDAARNLADHVRQYAIPSTTPGGAPTIHNGILHNIFGRIYNSGDQATREMLAAVGRGDDAAMRRVAEMISHAHAKAGRSMRGRAARGAALLAGLLALGWRYGK